MSKFKAGDVVKCERNAPYRYELTVGEEYIVASTKGNLVTLRDIRRQFNESRFELVAANPVEPFNAKRGGPFEKGDRVKCIDPGDFDRLSLGVEYTVERVDASSAWGGPYVFLEGESAGWNLSRFELVAPREPSVDELIAEAADGRREFERLQSAVRENTRLFEMQGKLCREIEARLNKAVAARVAKEASA